MSRKRKMIGLSAALIVLLAMAFTIHALRQEKNAASSAFVLFSVKKEEVVSITISYEDEVNTFAQSSGIWTLENDSDISVDQTLLNHMAYKLGRITVYKTIQPEEGLAPYGLDHPVCTVTFTGQAVHTLSIGSVAPMDSMRYVSSGDGNIYMVDETTLDEFSYQRADFENGGDA